MLNSRSNNNKIKHLHERYLRIVYQDKQSSYENLLVKDGTVSMHHRKIQALAIEMYKIKNDLSTEICLTFLPKGQKITTVLEMLVIFKFYLYELFITEQKVSYILEFRIGILFQPK